MTTTLIAVLLAAAIILFCLVLAGVGFLIYDHITHRRTEPDPEPPPWVNDARCWPRPHRYERCDR